MGLYHLTALSFGREKAGENDTSVPACKISRPEDGKERVTRPCDTPIVCGFSKVQSILVCHFPGDNAISKSFFFFFSQT